LERAVQVKKKNTGKTRFFSKNKVKILFLKKNTGKTLYFLKK
jgi:YHS domain-containing protein